MNYSPNTGALPETTWKDFLKILKTYELKQVSRSSTNRYYCKKDGKLIVRRETTAEHIYSCLKLADYFLELEEFRGLDRLRIYQLLMYHDDVEIRTGDVGIAELEKRVSKATKEALALPVLTKAYPVKLGEKLLSFDAEYLENKTPEAQFVHAIDKMDALVHELQYPEDWGPETGFTEETVRKWFGPAFAYSATFTSYFETMIGHLRDGKYFEVGVGELGINAGFFDAVLPELVGKGKITPMQCFEIGKILGEHGTKSAAATLTKILAEKKLNKKVDKKII